MGGMALQAEIVVLLVENVALQVENFKMAYMDTVPKTVTADIGIGRSSADTSFENMADSYVRLGSDVQLVVVQPHLQQRMPPQGHHTYSSSYFLLFLSYLELKIHK